MKEMNESREGCGGDVRSMQWKLGLGLMEMGGEKIRREKRELEELDERNEKIGVLF